jgi:hypothetical protein
VPMSYVATSTATDPGSATSVVINRPTGVQDGDVLVASYTSNDNFWNIPAGWTALHSTPSTGSNSFRSGLAAKVASSEPSTYTFAKDVGAADGAPLVVTIIAIRGCDVSSGLTSAIQNSASVGASSVSSGATPGTSISVSQNQAPGRLLYWRNSRATADFTFSIPAGGWTIGGQDMRWSGGTVRYGSVVTYTGDFGTTSASRTPTHATASQTTQENVYHMVSLLGALPTTAPTPAKADATVTAYPPASLTVATAATQGPVTATAYDATTQVGKAAENVPQAPVTVTAYNAKGWVIHPVDVGVVAFDAKVAVATQAETAQVSVTLSGGHGYFGAPESRRWRIPAEDRTWRVARESRAWTIPAEDRSWRIPSED